MRLILCPLAVLLTAAQPANVAQLTFTTGAGSYAIVRFQLDEASATATAATAVDLMINGARDKTVVLTPGVRRRSYSALLGPLSNGSHELRLQPSTLWTWSDSLRVAQPSVEVVACGRQTDRHLVQCSSDRRASRYDRYSQRSSAVHASSSRPGSPDGPMRPAWRRGGVN